MYIYIDIYIYRYIHDGAVNVYMYNIVQLYSVFIPQRLDQCKELWMSFSSAKAAFFHAGEP